MQSFKRLTLTIQQRLWIWCLLFLLVGAACVHIALNRQQIVQTNLLALLPETERNLVAEDAIQRLANLNENRAVFLIGNDKAEQTVLAARQFAQSLRDSGAFANVTLEIDAGGLNVLRSWIKDHRFQILSTEDQKAFAASTAHEDWITQRVQSRLISPIAGPQTLDLADDPLGVAQSWFDSLPFRFIKLMPQSGMLMVEDAGRSWAFIHTTIKGAAYDHTSAEKVIHAVKQAESAIQPSELLRAGTVFHAESARTKAQSDVDLIGIGSLTGMLLLLYWVFRSPRPLIASLLSIVFGVACASVICIAVYGELHLITLVFGASLIGEAVDYAVQYFAAHLNAGPNWQPLDELHRMTPGLCVALGTSLLGYGALWLSPFLALSQIALFAIVGLFSVWITVFLLLPWWMRKPPRQAMQGRLAFQKRWLEMWQHKVSPRRSLWLAALVLLVSVPGWFHLESHDDVRLLIATDTALTRQEAQLKTLTGVENSSQFFLIEGRSEEEVLQREEALRIALIQPQAQGDLKTYQAISLFVPSQARQQAALSAWENTVFTPPHRLPQALDQAGLQDHVAIQLRDDFEHQKQTELNVQSWMSHPVSTPLRQLWLGQTAHGYASVLSPSGLKLGADLSHVAQQVPGVSWVDKAGSVSRLFQTYRQYSAAWLVGALILVMGLLAWRYGWRTGGAVLLPTLLAIAFSFGAYGFLGHSLTLFNMMAFMLVLGVGVNYAIFLVEGGARSAATFAGVQVSAATTLLSFGLLALSSMPVLSGFGLSLTLGIGCAVLLAPMALSLAPQNSEPPCL